jgi:hypothetical protein
MELIKHEDPKYGFFVGYKGMDPKWQPDKIKARYAFKDYLIVHPSTTAEKELDKLKRIRSYIGKVRIIRTW